MIAEASGSYGERTDNQPCGRSGRLQFCTNQQAGIARFHSYHAYGGELHRHITTGKSQRRNSRLAETDRRKQHQQQHRFQENAKAGWRHQYAHLSFQPAECIRQSAELRNIPQYRPERLEDAGKSLLRKGKIELKVESYTENTELKALFEKQIKSTCPIENTFLKYFPKSTLALFSIGINGEEFYNVLQENEQFRNDFSITKAAEVKDLFSAFHNDLTIGLINVTMNSNPSFLAYASVKNDAPLKALYEKKSELGLKRGEDIVKLNENEYVYKSRAINIFFGIRDKQMYATNDELLYKNACKTADPSAKETDFASSLKGKRTAFVINAEAVLDLPVVKMLAGFGGQEYSTYYSLLGNISYLEAVGNEDKATVTLQLKNKNVNALKQIVDFIKQFAGM